MSSGLLFVVSIVAGLAGALSGMGGGMVLIPVLTLFGTDIKEAIAILGAFLGALLTLVSHPRLLFLLCGGNRQAPERCGTCPPPWTRGPAEGAGNLRPRPDGR